MKVYALYEGSMFGPHDVKRDMYYHLEDAVRYVNVGIQHWQKQYDQLCNQGIAPVGKRWKQAVEQREYVVKSWNNGIDEIYIREHELK